MKIRDPLYTKRNSETHVTQMKGHLLWCGLSYGDSTTLASPSTKPIPSEGTAQLLSLLCQYLKKEMQWRPLNIGKVWSFTLRCNICIILYIWEFHIKVKLLPAQISHWVQVFHATLPRWPTETCLFWLLYYTIDTNIFVTTFLRISEISHTKKKKPSVALRSMTNFFTLTIV